MKRCILYAACFTLLLAGAVWAQDTLEIISETGANGGTEYTVRAAGQSFSVISRRTLSADQKSRISALARTLYGSKYMKVRSIKMSVSDTGRIDIYLIPQSFTYKGINLASFIPSGMQFYDEEALEYDFRMNVQKVFIRIKGRLLDEESLAEKMYSAYKDPIRFVQMQDTDYINKRFDELAEQFGIFKSDAAGLKVEFDSQKAAYTAENEEQAKRIATLEAEIAQLKTDNEALSKQLAQFDQLSKRDEELSKAALTIGNRSFFGKTTPIAHEKVEKVVALKKEKAALTPEEAVSALKAENVTISLKEVKLIFAVYFNEF